MRKIRADIIEMARTRYAVPGLPHATWLLVPINRIIKADGDLVMGAGLAKVVADNWPNVPRSFALQLRAYPRQMPFCNVPFDRHGTRSVQLVGFPTKKHWSDDSSLTLIASGLHRLRTLMLGDDDVQTVLMPHLGCGHGGLSWYADVLPVVESLPRRCRRRIVICDLNEEERYVNAPEGDSANY
jgi:hypothetical protein